MVEQSGEEALAKARKTFRNLSDDECLQWYVKVLSILDDLEKDPSLATQFGVQSPASTIIVFRLDTQDIAFDLLGEGTINPSIIEKEATTRLGNSAEATINVLTHAYDTVVAQSLTASEETRRNLPSKRRFTGERQTRDGKDENTR